MKLTAIIGRAGCGKSRGLFEEAWENIRISEPKLIKFLVPEQATHHTERRLISPPDIAGCFMTEVVSFRRLFSRLNRGEEPRIIDEVEKRLLLASIMRRKDFEAEPFAAIKGRPGFIASLSEQIMLLKRADSAIAEIEKICGTQEGEGFTDAKLAFICRIIDAYQNELNRLSLRDSEDCISGLAEMAKDEGALKGVTWFIDGFSGFTPQEKAALEGLMDGAAEVKAALCLDPAAVRKGLDGTRDLFRGNLSTFEWFRDLSKSRKYDFVVKEIQPDDMPRFASKGMAALESNLFKYKKSKADPSGVKFIQTLNERDAARRVAYEIKQLVHDGFRYRDIAVVVRGLGSFADNVVEAFNDAGFPYFIDKRDPLRGHPLSRLVAGAWELVQKNFHRDALLDTLRTGLAPISANRADEFENYLFAYGLNFDLIMNEWYGASGEMKHSATRMERRESLRESVDKILKPLQVFVERINEISHNSGIIEEYSAATLQLMEEWELEQRMSAASPESELNEDDEQRAYDAVVDTLHNINDVMGDEFIPPPDYAAVLRSALDVLSTGRIPPVLDAVMVGEIHRSRVEETRAVFVCGLEEGVFPRAPSGAGLFDERELRGLTEQFPNWATDYRLLQDEEEYLFYIACTRAKEKLYLLSPLATDRGGAPSPFIREAKHALGMYGEDEPETVEQVCLNSAEIAGMVAASCNEGTMDDSSSGAYAALLEHAPESHITKYIFSSLAYINAPELDKKLGELRSGLLKRLDASRLRAFANCPFQYFARYDMKLRPRLMSDVTQLEIGTFVHNVLEYNFKKWFMPGIEVNLDDASLLADEAVAYARGLAEEFRDGLLAINPREASLLETRIFPLLREFVESEIKRLNEIPFRPREFEWRFGIEGVKGVMLRIPDKGEIELTGALDRIDVGTGDGIDGAIALDYKTSRAKSGLPKKVAIGLEVQIPIYIRALTDLLGYKSYGGLLFFLIKDTADSAEKAKGISFKRRGMFIKGAARVEDKLALGSTGTDGVDEEEFNRILDDAFTRIGEYGRKLMNGDIDVRPYIYKNERPCEWCDYRDLCRLDTTINRYRHPEVES